MEFLKQDKNTLTIQQGFIPSMRLSPTIYTNTKLSAALLNEHFRIDPARNYINNNAVNNAVNNSNNNAINNTTNNNTINNSDIKFPELSSFTQLANISTLPTLKALYGMPDLHCGYGFPIGSVAGFDLDDPACIVSSGGVGYDINCGVRCVVTSLDINDMNKDDCVNEMLADLLYESIPTGTGVESGLRKDKNESYFNKDVLKKTVTNINEMNAQLKSTNLMNGTSQFFENVLKTNISTSNNSRSNNSTSNNSTSNNSISNISLDSITNKSPLNNTQKHDPIPQLHNMNLSSFNELLEHGLNYLTRLSVIPHSEVDLVESNGMMPGNSRTVGQQAKARGMAQLASLGSGNHYLEIQYVSKIFDKHAAETMGIMKEGQVLFTIHTGSRGVGHNVCSEYLKKIQISNNSDDYPSRDNSSSNLSSNLSKDNSSKDFSSKDYLGKNNLGRDNLSKDNLSKDNSSKDNLSKDYSSKDYSSKDYLSRDLGCTRANDKIGSDYLSAMSCASNFAFCNRALIDKLARSAINKIFPHAQMNLLYDVCHNIAKKEVHTIENIEYNLLVHRKGASRAFAPYHKDVPDKYKHIGQPVLVGGSMGTSSYILVGTADAMSKSLGSSCHGAGRLLSRGAAKKAFTVEDVLGDLSRQGIVVRAGSLRGLVEEAPGSYKDVDVVAELCEDAGISRRVVQVKPIVVIKG